MGDLLQAVAGDRKFSAQVRIECLDILLTRMLAERPGLVNPINLARMCHQVATIHKERRGQSHGSMPEVLALSRKLSPLIAEHVTCFDVQGVSNTAWASAVNVPELVSSVVSAEHLERKDYSDIEWLQIYQALIAAGVVRADACYPERYNSIVSGYKHFSPSSFENSVGAALRGALSSTQQPIEFGKIFAGVATDWVVEFDGRKVVVECDGTDYHSTRGPDAGRRLGKDILQDRIFARFGYEAAHIDFSEWDEERDRVTFLREKLGI